MSIKGLKEALAKKQTQKMPSAKNSDGVEVRTTASTSAAPVSNRPQKKVTGRGR